MAPAPLQLLLAAAAAVACLSTASAQIQTIEARLLGIGSDYMSHGIHFLECEATPANGAPSFRVGCTAFEAQAFQDETITMDIEDVPQQDVVPGSAEERALALDLLLGIRRPTRVITATNSTGGARKRARKRRHNAPDSPRSALLVRLEFADMEVTYATEAEARLMMHDPGSNGQDVDGLFRASTYERISFPAASTTVVTVTSPRNGNSVPNCDAQVLADIANELVADQHLDVNMNTFIHKVYLIPDQVPHCRWSGVAALDACHDDASPQNCRSWIRTSSAPVLAHELGHNLGVRHAADDTDDDGVKEREYGDAGAIMGLANRFTSMNAAHREILGYLGDGLGVVTHDVACAAEAPAEVTLTISRLDLAPGGSNPNPNMVRIARYPAMNYLLSFKALADWDGSTADDAYINRLQIHTHVGPDATNNTMFVKALGEGEVFTGLAIRDGSPTPLTIRIETISADTITITVNTGCTNYQGAMVCGQTVTGNTGLPGTDSIGAAVGGKAGDDHFWDFTVSQPTTVNFDGCAAATTFDTVITIFGRLEPDADGVVRTTATRLAQDDEGCTDSTGATGPSRVSTNLLPGDYSVVLEGYGDSDRGAYSMTMACEFSNFQGSIACGETVSGTTSNPGTDSVSAAVGGKAGYDHFWHFTLDVATTVTFNGCGTSFDSAISLFEQGNAVRRGQNDDGGSCGNGNSRLRVTNLEAGDYSVVMEGYGTTDEGPYSMVMECQAVPTNPPTNPPTPPPTNPPTPAPTPAPTTPPTNPPTTRLPTSPPTTPPTTAPPTDPAVYLDQAGYCPSGYGAFGIRYRWALGLVVTVSSHQECADRCMQYSGPQYAGGCKSFMTGMYGGSLLCRSYGGTRFDAACASWAAPSNRGQYSGALGSTSSAGQENVGGNCCTNQLWLFGNGPTPPPSFDDDDAPPPPRSPPSSPASPNDSDGKWSTWGYVLGIALILVALVLVYLIAHRRGLRSGHRLTDTQFIDNNAYTGAQRRVDTAA